MTFALQPFSFKPFITSNKACVCEQQLEIAVSYLKEKLEEKAFFEKVAKKRYDTFPSIFYERILSKITSPLQRGSLIIDVGCGAGAWSIRLAERGYTVIGIDISVEMVKSAYRFAKFSGINFFGVCGDAENLPFRKDIFDCAFYGFSLHHIPKTLLTLQEAFRCLKPGKIIILVEPNGSNPIRRLSNVVGKIFNRTRRYCFSSPLERPLDISFVFKLLKACNFNDIHVSMDYTLLKAERENIVTRIMTYLRDFLLMVTFKLLPKPYNAVNFIIVAKKQL